MYLLRLETLRNTNELTQTEIATALGIKQPQYARYEKGDNLIPLHYLLELADFYNTSVDYILGRTNIQEAYPKGNKKHVF